MTVMRRLLLFGGAPAAFSPASLPGLLRWLDASQLVGLADNDPVSTFTDQSGNNGGATSTLTARPLYKTGVLVLPVLRFDGSNDTMATAAFAATLAQPATIIAVAKYTTSSANMYIFDGIDTTNRMAAFTNNTPGLSQFAGSTLARALTPGAWRVFTATFDTSDAMYADDGRMGSANGGAGALAGLTLGSRWDKIAGSFLGMDLAEVIVYNRVLSTTERRQILRYLVAKWDYVTDPNDAVGGGNAAAALTTPTYDGSGQAIHPDVVDFGAGTPWNGYRYWMVMTPYPNNDNTKENPSILASNDGTTWEVPPGLTNPIVAYPGSPDYNSDPCLLRVGATLYLYYRTTTATTDTISVVSSTDGVTWSAPATVISGTANRIVAPSVVYDGSVYRMFHIDLGTGSPYAWQVRTCATPNGTFSAAVRVYLDPPTGQDLWHITVFRDTATSMWHALIATVPSGTNGGVGYLYFATSPDGYAWVLADSPVVSPGTPASVWDSFEIYRAGAARTASGYDVWYSARTTATQTWGTGRTTIALP